MKNLLVLAILSTLIACTHDIEVYGNGSVLSASGNRSCQQSMEVTGPCQVSVVGDYTETYTAVPGSELVRFDRWENCPTAEGNVCEADIPAAYVRPLWGKDLGFALEAHFVKAPVPEGKMIYFQRSARDCWTDQPSQDACRRHRWPPGGTQLEVDFRAFTDGTGQIGFPTNYGQNTQVLNRRSWETGYDALTQDAAGRYYFRWENGDWELIAMMENYTVSYAGDESWHVEE